METKVLFLKEINEVIAVFPKEKCGHNGYRGDLVWCYSHIGQHSGCAPEYYKELPEAKQEEYKDLKVELESIGYKLKVINKL